MEAKGIVTAKYSTNTALRVKDTEGKENWYNAPEAVRPVLAKIAKGDSVSLTFEKKGTSRIISTLSKSDTEAVKPKTGTETDDTKEIGHKPPRPTTERIEYGSPEDIAGKEVGCAAGCAASILTGRPEEPDVLLQMFGTLLQGIVEKIRALK